MGAVTFSLDPKLVAALKAAIPFAAFVETGTFEGDTVAAVQPHFDRVITIELSEALWAIAKERFAASPNVDVRLGHSPALLSEVVAELADRPTLYWLDAHWCVAADTVGQLSQCPLLNELRAIGRLRNHSVILIDDARLFMAPPAAPHEISHWPSFHQIISCLLAASSEHELMVVNDVIAYYPKSAEEVMVSYAQRYGADWLAAANCIKQSGSILLQLEEKERIIQEQAQAIEEQVRAIEEQARASEEQKRASEEQERAIKEQGRVIAEQGRAVEEKQRAIEVLAAKIARYERFNWAIPLRKHLVYLRKKSYAVLCPRLGHLNQYPPRPLTGQTLHVTGVPVGVAPRISIVTPSFQQGTYIERTIKSVLGQGYPNLEYFVQDGGSSDQTVSVLKSYAQQLSAWRSAKDNGQSQAINLGFANATGEIMAWLNSDDLLLPGVLAYVADYFVRHPDVDVVYGNRLLIDENDMEIGRWIMPGHDGAVLSWADYVPQETMFWRRRLWDKVGGRIDESFRFAMDWDLLIRFRDAGARFAHLPRFLGAFRIHVTQKTSAAINDLGIQEMNRIRERIHGRVPSVQEIRRAVIPFMARHVAVDLAYRINVRMQGRR